MWEFNFTPQNLAKTAEKIKKSFPTEEELSKKKAERYQDADLENLLEKIEKTQTNKLNDLAKNLINKEIYILAYNFNEIPEELQIKVKDILVYRSQREVIKIMWSNFCNNYGNQQLFNYFIDSLTEINKFDFNTPPYSIFENIFANGQVINNLADYIDNNQLLYQEGLDNLNLNQEQKVSLAVAEKLFTKQDTQVFKREKVDFLVSLLSSLEVKRLKKIVENYILIFSLDDFSEKLMELFQKKLGDPRKQYSKAWDNIAAKVRSKARKWFNRKAMEDFFADIKPSQEEAQRRFNYWLQYENYLENVSYIKTRLQLFLIFNDFAVVEFGETGNAAYIYDREYFENNFSQYMTKKNAVSNSKLKHTGKARNKNNERVEKFNHSGAWEYNADNIIEPKLN